MWVEVEGLEMNEILTFLDFYGEMEVKKAVCVPPPKFGLRLKCEFKVKINANEPGCMVKI